MKRVLLLTICITVLLFVTISTAEMSGSLKIITDPNGASVILDGNTLGKTPLTIPDLSYGEYTFLIKKPGYKDMEKTVQVKTRLRTVTYSLVQDTQISKGTSSPIADEPVQTFKTTEKQSTQGSSDNNPQKVTVMIYSVPDNADVYIAGVATGQKTPASVEVTPGDIYVALMLDGYDLYEEEVAFPEESPLMVKLVTSTKSNLMILTDPADAEVILDGKSMGTEVPHLIKDVPFGSHTVEIKKAGYRPITDTISFSLDKTSFQYKLEATGGIVHVNSIPENGLVFYNGKPVDKTTPVTLKLPEGEYSIAVGMNAVPMEVQKIILGLGDEKTLNFVLDGPQGEVIHNKNGTITVGINTNPEGASISIDGTSSGQKTPAFITLRPGDHDVKLSMLSYQIYDEEIAFPEESPLNVDLHKAATDYPDVSPADPILEDGKVDVTISTNPDGAKVSITGDKGTKSADSPALFHVLPGTYTIKALLNGYNDYSSTEIIGDEGKDIEIEMESLYSIIPVEQEVAGSVFISSEPAGAAVTINDEYLGVTPLPISDLAEGSYECTVSLSGYEDTTHTVTISGGISRYYLVNLSNGEWEEAQALS